MIENNTKHSVPRFSLTRSTRLLGVIAVTILVAWQWDRVVDAMQIISRGRPSAWVLASALQFVCMMFAAFRLRLFVRSVEHSIPYTTLYADVVCMSALNAALVTGVGDLYRVKRTNEYIGDLVLSSSLVFLDRIFGFATICALGGLSMTLIGISGFTLHYTHLLTALAVTTLILVLVRKFARRTQRLIWDTIRRPFLALRSQPALGFCALAVSMGASTLWLASIVVISRGLGIDVDEIVLVFATTVVTVATILPISIGGIGVREAGYTLLLASHGVEPAQAIALGVAQYALSLPIVVMGLLIEIIRQNQRPRSDS